VKQCSSAAGTLRLSKCVHHALTFKAISNASFVEF